MGEIIQRRQLAITGLVQGVGFRPFLWRLARRNRLAGWVQNGPGGVQVEVEGPAAALDAFLASMQAEAPPLARIDGITLRGVAVAPRHEATGLEQAFVIRPSSTAGATQTGISPDVAPCEACLAEMHDPSDRRFRYPFLNCTNCGPRLTIQTGLPYDRPQTTLAGFEMCEACAREYADPADRRFHAQPIACPHCGPAVWYSEPGDAHGLAVCRSDAVHLSEHAITIARAALRAGAVLAVKGVGGFHLICDATNAGAVARLRARKHRPRKPFAVMVPDLASAAMLADVDDQSARFLEDASRPIVLLPKRHPPLLSLADTVAPESDFVGVMLPSSPLHGLLIECVGEPVRPLVVTSGNLSDEPIAHTNTDATSRLATLADGFVMHDRLIEVPCDDSVVRCVAGMPQPIRLGRGHAPTTLPLPDDGPCVLAVGGDLKGALCLALARQAIVGPHLGDLASPEAFTALTQSAEHLLALYGAQPSRIVADLHPGALSTAWARKFATARRVPLVQVQHHEAHAASLLCEHGLSLNTHEPVLVACFDGTGYGHDGTIQGGEFLLVHAGAIRRIAHLARFPLPGGEAALREPWRAALGFLSQLPTPSAPHPWPAPVKPASDDAIALVGRQAALGIASPQSTSMGRLFDAVASLTGLQHRISFEAEAAMQLEAAAVRAQPLSEPTPYAFDLPSETSPWPHVISWHRLLGDVCRDVAADVPPPIIAHRFHEAVANLVVDLARGTHRLLASRLSGTPLRRVGMTGGVFQNRLLCELTLSKFDRAGFEPLLPTRLPANDGGLSLGQAVLGRRGA